MRSPRRAGKVLSIEEDTMARGSARTALIVAAAALALPGCAHTYVDEDGSRHVIGLVWLDLPPPAVAAGADGLRVRTIGISTLRSPAGSSLVLGYADSDIVVVPDDRVVNATPLLAARK
jgi:hypothetical protein